MAVAIAEHRIAYMPVPKAACSSVKAALATIDPHVDASIETLAEDEERVHAIYPTRRFRPHRWEAFEGWWRFTVVRDPLQRLFAAWTDRVHGRGELINSRRLRLQTHLPPDPDPDFFFQHLREYMEHASVVKHHALTVRLFIGPAPLRFDRVFRVEEISELAQELTDRAGQPITIPRFNTSDASLALEDLAPRTRTALVAHLAEDYELLSHLYDSPFS